MAKITGALALKGEILTGSKDPVSAEKRRGWLKERQSGLGGSDMASILAGRLFGVWASKTAEIESVEHGAEAKDADSYTPEYMEWGKRLERPIAEAYALARGVDVEWLAEVTFQHPEHPWWLGSPDGRIIAIPRGLEIKNRGISTREAWGEDGTDQVPEGIAVQVCHYMPITPFPELGRIGADAYDIAVLWGGNKMRTWTVSRDPAVEAMLEEEGEKFWRTYVIPRVAPPLDASDSAAKWLKKRFSSHVEEIRDASPEEVALVGEYRRIRSGADALAEQADAISNQIRAAIGDQAGIRVGDARVTWRQAKGTVSVDYSAAFRDLAAGIRESGDPVLMGMIDSVISKSTVTKPGVRRFICPKEKE